MHTEVIPIGPWHLVCTIRRPASTTSRSLLVVMPEIAASRVCGVASIRQPTLSTYRGGQPSHAANSVSMYVRHFKLGSAPMRKSRSWSASARR